MAVPLISCPLCSQPGFTTLESLRDGLIGSATRQIVCPVCHDILVGLDKFTIHLFSHFLQNNCNNQQSYHSQPQSHHIDTRFNINQHQRHDVIAQSFNSSDNLVQVSYNLQNNANIISHHSPRKNPHPVKASLPYLHPPDIKPTSEASITAKVFIEKHTSATEQQPIINNTTNGPSGFVDNTFENVALLESCGLKQDVLGIISKMDAVNPKTDAVALQTPGTSDVQESRSNRSRSNSIKSSKLTVDIEPDLRCQLCGFTFPDDHILTLHRQLVHNGDSGNDKKPFGCYLCSKEFKMRGSLMVHLRVAHGGAAALRNIVNKDADSAKQFTCATCGKAFKKDQHLSQHMKTHEGKQWPCDICQKLFTTKYFLKKHKRLHTGEMPYSCNVCAKTFTFQQSMHKHALYHRDDKPHACTECNRTFKELSTLHNHRRIHTGEKPFACETCGKCFRQRVSYLVHRRIHTGIMPYKCTACGKSFRYKVSERTHKCPSQPPGTVVRQAGDLVQKLQQRAALQASEQQSAYAGVTPTKLSDQELLNTNQFIIILDDMQQNVYVSAPLEDTSRAYESVPPRTNKLKQDNEPIQKSKDSGGLDLMVETADFFSIVENMPSPSDGLRNLTISSPAGTKDTPDEVSNRSDIRLHPEILQTINEDSIKEFLYGTSL